MNQSQQNSVTELRIEEDSAGQRIDNFLVKSLKGVPKSRIYRILRTGEVRVNRGRIKPDYRLQQGDTVRIPPIRVSEQAPPARPGERIQRLIEASILYEDKGFLVINKPSGLAVHGGSGVSFGVIEGLRAMRPEAHFLELAHRLDRDTSGVLVLCKKRSALRAFQEQLRENQTDKKYLALVRGKWKGGARRVSAALRKNVLSSGERVVRVADDGKESLSIFEPVAIFGNLASLVRVSLITGRTHQVRVHANHIGHPIAGDEKYGDEAFNRQMSELGLKRLFLHAEELTFTLPESGKPLTIRAPLEPALTQILEKLEHI
ncbi:MAG TPA: 23S rRNA pseudouridine(955/2504/2580) synthase RluC [Gammaproteobacteria bacterium]